MPVLKLPLRRFSLASQIGTWGEFVADNFCYVLWIYFFSHLVIRWYLCPNIGWYDDAEVAISTDAWRWFYHPNNPPLYHWLLFGMYKIFGVSPLSHFILKNCLMGVTLYSLYRAGLYTFQDKIIALCIGLSPLFIKDWGIWGQFKFTHSNLLVCAMALTLWQVTRFIKEPTQPNALLLGVIMAFGFISKYNYAFFALPCLGALFVQKETRKLFSIQCVVWIILPCLLLVGSHLYHALAMHHQYDLTTLVARKFSDQKGQSYGCVILTILDQFRVIITQVIEQTTPLNIGLSVVLFVGRNQLRVPHCIAGRFFVWQQIFAFASLIGMVLGFGITNQPKRYILPFILSFPFVIFACLPHLNRIKDKIAAIFVALFVVREAWGVALMVSFILTPSLDENVMFPQGDYRSFAHGIEQEGRTILITDDLIAAGNLKFHLPSMTIYKIGYNDFWLTSLKENGYNQNQIVYLCAKKQCSGKINLPTATKPILLSMKKGCFKEYELVTPK